MARKFWTQHLFNDSTRIQLSFSEIAEQLNVSQRTAKRYVQRDLENGLIRKKSTAYRCKKYRTLLSGRNVYFLSKKDQHKDQKSQKVSPQSKLLKSNFYLKDIAKGTSLEFSLNKKLKALLEAPEIRNRLKSYPKWWFRDQELLMRSLRLMKHKLKRGYKIKSPMKWLSFIISQEGMGYVRSTAHMYSKLLSNEEPFCKQFQVSPSEYVSTALENLSKLKSKGLSVDPLSMSKLLRKGFSHLALSAKVLCQLLSFAPPKTMDGFLNWIVSKDDPVSVFKAEHSSPEDAVKWAKNFFSTSKDLCVFDDSNHFDGWVRKVDLLDMSRKYVQFRVYECVEQSYARLLFYSSELGRWEEVFVSTTSPTFVREVRQAVAL